MRREAVLAALLMVASRIGSAYTITTNTTWSGNQHVTESVTITNGATLRIDAGTTVELPANAYLRVDRSINNSPGRIVAEGTTTQPIVFTRLGHRNGSGRWAKLRLSQASVENRFKHCQFWYGDGTSGVQGGNGVISTRAARLLVEDSQFYYFMGDATYIGETGQGSTATFRRCYFSTGGNEIPGTGGKQCITIFDSSVEEDSCIFAYRTGYNADATDAEGTKPVWAHDCIFLGADYDDGTGFDTSGSIVERCWFFNYNGTGPDGFTHCSGTSQDERGPRYIRNNVYVNCIHGIMSKGHSSSLISNCTFINCKVDVSTCDPNELPGKRVGYATIRNCIMWGTTSQTLQVGVDTTNGDESSIDIDWCDVSSTGTLLRGDHRVTVGSNIFTADPLFVNPAATYTTAADYHERSKAGRWDPKANGGAGAWVIDTVHSPVIDAGDPSAGFVLEPAPNGNRVNLGAYGNTPQASKSIPLYRLLTIVTPSTGGTVVKTPPGPLYFYNNRVQLRAYPLLGYRFDHWQGDTSGTTNPVYLAMNRSKSVTAVFVYTPPRCVLQVNVTPTTGGTVTKTPNRPLYYVGESVQLRANPATNYRFVRWQGAVSGTVNPTSVVMNTSKTLTAVFAYYTAADSRWTNY